MPHRVTSSGINYRDAAARSRAKKPRVDRHLCGCRRLLYPEEGPTTVALDPQGVEVCFLPADHPFHQEQP